MNISGTYRSSYNSDEKGPLYDGKSKKTFDGPAEARRKALRERIYERFGNRDKARDRTFVVREAPDGKLFLYRSYLSR